MSVDEEQMTVRVARPKSLCRWWLNTRACKPSVVGGAITHEFYVPWWAWPLELLYNFIFGKAKLEENKNGNA